MCDAQWPFRAADGTSVHRALGRMDREHDVVQTDASDQLDDRDELRGLDLLARDEEHLGRWIPDMQRFAPDAGLGEVCLDSIDAEAAFGQQLNGHLGIQRPFEHAAGPYRFGLWRSAFTAERDRQSEVHAEH
jgi:hypothetical protein